MSNVTLHHTNDVNAGTATCGITTVNVTTHHDKVTCKRCLARLAKAAETTDRIMESIAVQETAGLFTPAPFGESITQIPCEITPVEPPAVQHAVNPTNPRYTVCGTPRADVTIALSLDDVTCLRCLTKLDRRVDDADASKAPKAPKAPKEPRTPKAPKAPTVHLHDAERSTHQTWCKIPGVTTTDTSAVTCKVCRAHIDGKAPVNAVPERVKAARKAFRSFVARVAYMVFIDDGCTVNSWTVKWTNMAGDQYEVSSYGIYENGEGLGFGPGKNIKQWMEEYWSCGEDK